MRTFHSLLAVIGLLAVVTPVRADNTPEPAVARATPPPPAQRLSYGDATVLGLVEGITEFLPISSTGHLILATHVLGLDSTAPAIASDGTPLWTEHPDPAAGKPGAPFTVKAAADTYAVAIQFGAIAAVAILYWGRIRDVLLGLLGKNPAGLRLLRNLLLAFFPAVIAGLTLDDWIEERLFNPTTVAAALIVGAVIMVAADRWQRKRAPSCPDIDPADLRPGQALLVGVLQCFAMWPGMSRSMMTIVGGYVAGLRPARAAEFSFLLGLPTLAGAAVYKSHKTGLLTVEAFGIGPLTWGAVVAAVSAGLAVTWLVRFLTRHGLALFAWYRVFLAIGVLVLLGL